MKLEVSQDFRNWQNFSSRILSWSFWNNFNDEFRQFCI